MVTVVLTAEEDAAFKAAGTAEDGAIADFLYLSYVSRGIGQEQAKQLSEQLAAAALRARYKIAEATRYEIVVLQNDGK